MESRLVEAQQAAAQAEGECRILERRHLAAAEEAARLHQQAAPVLAALRRSEEQRAALQAKLAETEAEIAREGGLGRAEVARAEEEARGLMDAVLRREAELRGLRGGVEEAEARAHDARRQLEALGRTQGSLEGELSRWAAEAARLEAELSRVHEAPQFRQLRETLAGAGRLLGAVRARAEELGVPLPAAERPGWDAASLPYAEDWDSFGDDGFEVVASLPSHARGAGAAGAGVVTKAEWLGLGTEGAAAAAGPAAGGPAAGGPAAGPAAEDPRADPAATGAGGGPEDGSDPFGGGDPFAM